MIWVYLLAFLLLLSAIGYDRWYMRNQAKKRHPSNNKEHA